MPIVTPDLCDDYPEILVVEPGFRNFGGVDAFGGEIVTVKALRTIPSLRNRLPCRVTVV